MCLKISVFTGLVLVSLIASTIYYYHREFNRHQNLQLYCNVNLVSNCSYNIQFRAEPLVSVNGPPRDLDDIEQHSARPYNVAWPNNTLNMVPEGSAFARWGNNFDNDTCRVQYGIGFKTNPKDQARLDKVLSAIKLDYHQKWFVDEVPVEWCPYGREGTTANYCVKLIPYGCYVNSYGSATEGCEAMRDQDISEPNRFYIYNHHNFVIYYRKSSDQSADANWMQIVRVKVHTRSIAHPTWINSSNKNCSSNVPSLVPVTVDDPFSIWYTSSMTFIETEDIEPPSKAKIFLRHLEGVAYYRPLPNFRTLIVYVIPLSVILILAIATKCCIRKPYDSVSTEYDLNDAAN